MQTQQFGARWTDEREQEMLVFLGQDSWMDVFSMLSPNLLLSYFPAALVWPEGACSVGSQVHVNAAVFLLIFLHHCQSPFSGVFGG